MTELAYAAGPTDTPLLDETIGANLARTVDQHGSRDALVSVHQDIAWSFTMSHPRRHSTPVAK